jgi:23S rRNA (guanosine2251-2'-O)-methyltransferase
MWWREQDLNLRTHTRADLQSAAINHSAIPPLDTHKKIKCLLHNSLTYYTKQVSIALFIIYSNICQLILIIINEAMKIKTHKDSIHIYGKHPAIAALGNPKRKIIGIFVTRSSYPIIIPYIKNYPNIKIEILEPKDFKKIAPENIPHQDIIVEALPISQPNLEDVLENLAHDEKSCVIILDQITDPHNIGAILRSAAAFSASAVIIQKKNSPNETSTIAKVSSGAIEIVPLISVTNIAHCIKTLRKYGFWSIGLDGSAEGNIDKICGYNKIALVMGAEGHGVRQLTKELCDIVVKIPMSDKMESLNVSNAAAISLYEFYKLL